MSDKEMIALLRHKRHDWMNQIQLIQGYASLDKSDKLMEQIDEIKELAEQERRLLNGEAEQFPLWLLSFNWYQEQYRVQFFLQEEVDLSRHDKDTVACCKHMVEIMNEHKAENELYEGTVYIYQGINSESLSLSWEWEGCFVHPHILERKLSNEGFTASVFGDTELSIEMMIG